MKFLKWADELKKVWKVLLAFVGFWRIYVLVKTIVEGEKDAKRWVEVIGHLVSGFAVADIVTMIINEKLWDVK